MLHKQTNDKFQSGADKPYSAGLVSQSFWFVEIKKVINLINTGKSEKEIKEMPNYFSDYNTTVHFITEEELEKNHSGMAHGGFVIRTEQKGFTDISKTE